MILLTSKWNNRLWWCHLVSCLLYSWVTICRPGVLGWFWDGCETDSRFGLYEEQHKREITGRESQTRELTLPYWVAALIQQQTDPEKDHLSPLWSPYKSSTFPLFSSAAHKLIKLAFPCCSWRTEWARHPVRCIVGGRRAYELMRTDAHTPHSVQFQRSPPQNCYSYRSGTCAAFAYSWINPAEE